MELNHLRYIRAIGREGSLTRAARTLGVSQPTLSLAVQQLEAELHSRLILRHARGVELTPAGRELMQQADAVLTIIERIPQHIQDLDEGMKGTFTIGCYESLGAWFLPGLLRNMWSSCPSIELTLWNGPSQAVRDAAVRGEIHLGLVVNTVPHPDLVITRACRDVIEVVATRERLHDGPMAALKQGPLLHLDRPPFTGIIEGLAARGLLPRRLVPCGDLELVKSLALAGVGVAILPRRVARYGHPGILVPLDASLPSFEDTIDLVYRADLPRTRAAAVVKQEILAHGRRLQEED